MQQYYGVGEGPSFQEPVAQDQPVDNPPIDEHTRFLDPPIPNDTLVVDPIDKDSDDGEGVVPINVSLGGKDTVGPSDVPLKKPKDEV